MGEKQGRDYYTRGEGRAAAHRNGVRTARLKSAESVIEYAVPQVRGLAGWHSEIRAALSGRTEELERLAVEMYARGLSVRDIEATFTDETGCCALSKSAASKVNEVLWAQFQEFTRRDLSSFEVTPCSSMAWPHGCIWASPAKRSWGRGGLLLKDTKSSWASCRAPRKTPLRRAISSAT